MDLLISKLIPPYCLAWRVSNKAVSLSLKRHHSGSVTDTLEVCHANGCGFVFYQNHRPRWTLPWMRIVWTTGKHHQRSIDLYSRRTRGKWCRQTNILALPLRHDGLGLTNPKEIAKIDCINSMLIIANLTEKTTKTQSWLQPLRPTIYKTHEKQNTTREEWETQKCLWWTITGTDHWVTTTHKRSNGKRGIFLAVSLANQSD